MPEAVLKISVEIHCMVCTGCLDDCIPTVSCKLQQLCSLPQFCDELGVNCKLLWYRCEKSSRFRLMVFKSVFVPLRRYIFHVCCSFAL